MLERRACPILSCLSTCPPTREGAQGRERAITIGRIGKDSVDEGEDLVTRLVAEAHFGGRVDAGAQIRKSTRYGR